MGDPFVVSQKWIPFPTALKGFDSSRGSEDSSFSMGVSKTSPLRLAFWVLGQAQINTGPDERETNLKLVYEQAHGSVFFFSASETAPLSMPFPTASVLGEGSPKIDDRNKLVPLFYRLYWRT